MYVILHTTLTVMTDMTCYYVSSFAWKYRHFKIILVCCVLHLSFNIRCVKIQFTLLNQMSNALLYPPLYSSPLNNQKKFHTLDLLRSKLTITTPSGLFCQICHLCHCVRVGGRGGAPGRASVKCKIELTAARRAAPIKIWQDLIQTKAHLVVFIAHFTPGHGR